MSTRFLIGYHFFYGHKGSFPLSTFVGYCKLLNSSRQKETKDKHNPTGLVITPPIPDTHWLHFQFHRCSCFTRSASVCVCTHRKNDIAKKSFFLCVCIYKAIFPVCVCVYTQSHFSLCNTGSFCSWRIINLHLHFSSRVSQCCVLSINTAWKPGTAADGMSKYSLGILFIFPTKAQTR